MADSTTAANGGSNIDALKSNASAAYDSVANGPVAQNVKDQSAKTSAEFSNLAASRQTPANPAATGQPLTHYHSFFSELLSWNNPRASAIAYVSIVALVFSVRYLDVVRYGLKLTWMVLLTTIAAEVAGKTVLNTGVASQLRPRKYYTVSQEALNGLIGDVHELLNFFIIESQRILFVENIPVSALAFVGSLISYYLVKVVPYWGLTLIFTTVAFVAPLVYKSNQEFIDQQLKQVSDIVNSQTTQLKEVAGKHTAQATELTKQYMGDYTAKAQELLRGRSVSPSAAPKSASKPAPATATGKELHESDFPEAPSGFKTADTTAAADDVKAAPVDAEKEPLLAL